MKHFNLYFLTLILTLTAWATPSVAQITMHDRNTEIRQYSSFTQDQYRFDAIKVSYKGDLVTKATIVDRFGHTVCQLDQLSLDPENANVVFAPCQDFTIYAKRDTNGLDTFVFYMVDGEELLSQDSIAQFSCHDVGEEESSLSTSSFQPQFPKPWEKY